MLKRQDWPLLVLGLSTEQRLSPVKMQKALFLLGQGLRDTRQGAYYNFQPYHYGPFDQTVYDDLERLNALGLIRQVESRTYRGRDYELTSKGVARVRRLESGVPQRATTYIDKVVKWMEPLSFSELVAAIYDRFPEYKARSIFRS